MCAHINDFPLLCCVLNSSSSFICQTEPLAESVFPQYHWSELRKCSRKMRSPKSLRRSSLKFFFDGASVGLKTEKNSVCSPFLMLFLCVCLCFSCLFVLSLAHVMFYESVSAITFVKKYLLWIFGRKTSGCYKGIMFHRTFYRRALLKFVLWTCHCDLHGECVTGRERDPIGEKKKKSSQCLFNKWRRLLEERTHRFILVWRSRWRVIKYQQNPSK